MDVSVRHQSSHGLVYVSCTEDTPAGINSQNPMEVSPHTHTDSHGSISPNKQCLTSVTSCLLQETKNTVSEVDGEADGDGQHCPVVTLSFPSVPKEMDNKHLTHVISAAAEVENICTSKQHCRMVSEDDLSVFFASPVSVSSLSAKLKAIPKRKAMSIYKCEREVTSDSCDHAVVCSEHELNTMNCIRLPQQCTLPLHDASTSNVDKPADVATKTQTVTENSAVCHSSSIQLSLPVTNTSQCHLVHLPAHMYGDTSSGNLQLSDCLTTAASVSLLPSSSSSLAVPSQGYTSSCLRSMSSAPDQLSLDISSASVSLLDRRSVCDRSGLVSKSLGTQVKSCAAYSEKQLQMLVKHNCASNQRFVYPSATQVYHPPLSDVLEHTSNDASLLHARRSRSLLYRTPDVLQSGCLMVHSKSEEHMKKTASLAIMNKECNSAVKEIILDRHNDDAQLVLTSQAENTSLSASNLVSCDLDRSAVTSGRNIMCDIKDVNKAYSVSSMPECAVVEIYCDRAEKRPSQDVNAEPLTTALPSSVGGICCSKLMCDFSGQTSPRICSRTTLCDVGVQTSLTKLSSDDTSNVCKQPLLVNAAVQTVPVCWAHCTCSLLSKKSNSLARNKLLQDHDLHDTRCMTNASSMNCELFVPNIVSKANMCENQGTSANESAAESHCNVLLLHDGRVKPVSISNKVVSADNTASMLTAGVNGTVNQGASRDDAIVDDVLEMSQYVITNESSVNCFSAEFQSSVDTGQLHATECDTVSAHRGLSSLKTVTDSCAQVMSDIPLKSTNVSFGKSFSTGFMSAGGKPLNVKLSSKLNACKLLDDLACTEGSGLENATDTAHFSNTNVYNTRKVMQDLTRMDTDPCQHTTSGLVNTSNDRSVHHSSKGKSQQHTNVHDHTDMKNMSSESSCDLTDVCCKTSSSLTDVCELKSDNKHVINAYGATHQRTPSSLNLCSADRVADIMCSTAKQLPDIECTVSAHPDVNVDYASFNSGGGGMLHRPCSKDMTSNGFKPFKAPRTSLVSSKRWKNKMSTETDDEHLNASAVHSHSLNSEDKVSNVVAIELLSDLTNTQFAEVVDASLLMLNSAELFALPSSDDASELDVEKLVSHSRAAAPSNSGECAPNPNISTDSHSVPAANTQTAGENLLTEQVQYSCDKADTDDVSFTLNGLQSATCASVVHIDSKTSIKKSESIQIHNVEQKPAFCSLSSANSVSSKQEHDTRDIAGCCTMPTVSVDAGFAETKPVHVGSMQSSCDEEAGTDEVASCKICNFTKKLCSCATEKQNTMQSFQQTNTDDLTCKKSSFVFFSAKGSQINVSEKTLRRVRQNWNTGNHLTQENSVDVENRLTMKVADASEQSTNLHSSQDLRFQTNTEDMHARGVDSDISSCYANNAAIDEFSTDRNCDRNINADKTDVNTLMSVPVIGVHPDDIYSTSDTCKRVSEPNIKSLHDVSDDADISNGSVTSVHVSCSTTTECRLPFKSTNQNGDSEANGNKHPTDRNVRIPLYTGPESKLLLLLFVWFYLYH